MEVDNYDNNQLPVAGKRNAPKKRGRGSSHKREQDFRQTMNNKFHQERRAALIARLDPGLADTYQQYLSQQSSGSTTTKMIPVTTRGIGFHTSMFMNEAPLVLPRVELPPRADVFQMYRYSLMQLGRQMTLSKPQQIHTQAPRLSQRAKISTFTSNRNAIHIADSINQVGSFTFDGVNYQTYVPEEELRHYQPKQAEEVTYQPQSPDYSAVPKRKATPSSVNEPARIENELFTVPDPYHLTIHNLYSAVRALSNEHTPIELRRSFIHRSPIPGATFMNDLLVNPNDIMPYPLNEYIRRQFQQDVSCVDAFFDQISSIVPSCIGSVAMDGQGSELNLCTVRTMPDSDFSVQSAYGIMCPLESHMFATANMSPVNRLRSWTNLMNESPLLRDRTILHSSYGIRDPSQSLFSFTEVWQTLAWNVSCFRHHKG